MIIRKNAKGIITVKAESKNESQDIARFLGVNSDIKVGDQVEVNHQNPLTERLKFTVTDIEELNGQTMIGGEFGSFNSKLIVKSKC